MKPYDKSNSFMRRVTKRVSELIPGTTWMNKFLGESQSTDDLSSTSDNDDQPPVKRLCTSNNTFINSNFKPCVDSDSSINPTDNHKSSHVNVHLPEISAVTCVPGTSRQSPKFTSQSNASLQIHDRSSFNKRKSDVADLSNINRQTPKSIAFNFASSTPALVTANEQPVATNSLKRSLASSRSSDNEFLTPNSSKLIKPRDNESRSLLKLRETTPKHLSSASFRWDTFVNYGELSERQKLFAQKSPLNCSRVMYGGNSARSSLSKILGNTPPIHTKTVIPISPTNNKEIRTTSSILLNHISTKDKEIEENKFIIQPKVHQKHKADQKTVPLVVETTMKLVETIPEKTNENLLSCPDPDASRKLRMNISKKSLGQKFDNLEMAAKVDFPNNSLPVPLLPNIQLSNDMIDDNEFKFNQPLTIEQFSVQIAEKTSRKKHKMTQKKTQNTDTDSSTKYNSSFTILNQPCSIISTREPIISENDKVSILNNDKIESLNKNGKVSNLCKFGYDSSKDASENILQNSDSKSEFKKNPVNMMLENTPLKLESSKTKQQLENVGAQLKKWTCDACWVSNNSDIINCIACQTPKPGNSQKPLKVSQPSICETSSLVPSKKDDDKSFTYQSPKSVKTVVEPSSTWTCDACWVKNKSDCTSCISCGTAKPGSASENKLQPSTQFKFGLNNNTFEQSSSSTQFKFGFDSSKNDQSPSQFKFGSTTTLKSSENGKAESSIGEFKFGMVNNKTDLPPVQFKFGIDSTVSQPTKKLVEVSNSNNNDQSESQFKFGFEKKLDQQVSQFKFGQNATTSKPLAQFKFGSDNFDTEKSVKHNVDSDNKVTQSVNELSNVVNNKNEKSTELPNKSSAFTFGSTILHNEKSIPQATFGSIETNCNSLNSLSNNTGLKNDELSKGKSLWEKKDKIEVKPVNLDISSQTVQPNENTNTVQLVNGHSHTNDTSNEDQIPSLMKIPPLFSFGGLASKQEQSNSDISKKNTAFTFGSTTNDSKSFVIPALATSSFPNTNAVFGTSNSMFSTGSITSSATTLGSSIPQFTFGSIAPTASNNIFSKTSKDNDKKTYAQATNSFTASTNIGFSFGAQSPPAFSVPNASGFMKSPIQGDDQTKNTSIPNAVFSQSSTKPIVKLDPNAPISINFTGGATTQFTAKPETSEPAPKRKILKPVRRIR